MIEAEKKIGRIEAVISAAEEVINGGKGMAAKYITTIAKETAYDRIKSILNDMGYNPYQE